MEHAFTRDPGRRRAITVTAVLTLSLLGLLPVAHGDPATAPATRPATGPARPPVPEEAAWQGAQRKLWEQFRAEYDQRTPADRRKLAIKLLLIGFDAKDDPAARFARFTEARDLAAAAGEAGIAMEAVDAMAETFTVPAAEAVKWKVEALEAVGAVPDTPVAARVLGHLWFRVGHDALAAKRYDAAKGALAKAAALADQAGDEFLTGLAKDLSRRAAAAADSKGAPAGVGSGNGIDFAALAAAAESPNRTPVVGGRGGSPFYEAPRQGAIVVGFRYTTSKLNDRVIVKSLRPIYLTEHGKTVGDNRGTEGKELKTVEAPPGYAVGGVIARGSDRLDGLRVLFMPIDGPGLNPDGVEEGEWIGAGPAGGAGGETKLGGDGKPVIGLHGRRGDDVDCLGLVQAP